MKLLFISQNFPYPPYNDGARLKTYNLIKYLSKYNKIYFITFCSREEEDFIKKIAPFCSKVITVPIRKKGGKWAKTIKLVRNVIDPRRCTSKKMESEIAGAVKLWEPDIVHVELPMMSPYSKTIRGIPKIIASHDAISLYAYKNLKSSNGLINKGMWYWLYRQRRWIEENFYPDYDACTVVSDEDRIILEKHCPGLNIKVIPSGVDIKYFDIKSLNSSDIVDDLTIGIFGSMSFVPNIDAVMYFISEIYPLIKKEIPNVRFFIVGRNPPDNIKSLANNKDIIVTGEVEDIREYYKKVSVVVAPIRLGSGIKNTMLQAMSMDRPIVASPQAVKAITVEDGIHYLKAGSPKNFADKIVNLLNNPSHREALAKSARNLVVEKYSWETHAEVFQSLYENTLNRRT